MSVNYYLDAPHSGRHLGKLAFGHFTAYAPAGIDTFEDWQDQLTGHTVYAEHGVAYSPEEFLAMLAPEQLQPPARRARQKDREWVAERILFVRHEFF